MGQRRCVTLRSCRWRQGKPLTRHQRLSHHAGRPEAALKQGDTFPITLGFADAGRVMATVTVQKADGGMPMGHDAVGGMLVPGKSP